MIFFVKWIMFYGPTGFLSSQGKEVDSTEIKGNVGQKYIDWPKFDYFIDFLRIYFFCIFFTMFIIFSIY